MEGARAPLQLLVSPMDQNPLRRPSPRGGQEGSDLRAPLQTWRKLGTVGPTLAWRRARVWRRKVGDQGGGEGLRPSASLHAHTFTARRTRREADTATHSRMQ